MSKFRNGSEKLTIKEAIGYTWRAIKILHKQQPENLIFGSIQSALWAISPLLTLYFSSLVIGELAGGRDVQKIIIFVTFAVIQGFLFSLVSGLLHHIFIKRGGYDTWERARTVTISPYASMDYKYVEDTDVNKLKSDIDTKANSSAMGLLSVSNNIPSLFGQTVTFCGAAVILSGMFRVSAGESFVTSHWMLILLITLSVLVPTLINTFVIKKSTALRQKRHEELSKVNVLSYYYYAHFIRPSESGMDTRIYNLHEPILKVTIKCANWFRGKMYTFFSLSEGFTYSVGVVFSVFAYIVIGLRALEGIHDIGEVTRYVGGVTSLSLALTSILSRISTLKVNAPYLGSLYDFLDLPSVLHQGSREINAENNYELEFHNVSFKYPGSENYALKNLNLKINNNERLAIVGMNGSGKTTMIKLLCRLYDPTEGTITLNGTNIKEYDYEKYIAVFSVVFQDFSLTGLPISQNIAVNADYDVDKVKDALVKAGAPDLDLSTPILKDYGNQGVNISGGEAQKIAIARAIYKNAPIIIMDEPTASLDPIAEYEIYSKLNEIIGGKTAIFISHRLSSCRFCHEIAVFHEGTIIQKGSHDMLLADAGGKYFEMWNAQAGYYSLNANQG